MTVNSRTVFLPKCEKDLQNPKPLNSIFRASLTETGLTENFLAEFIFKI